MEYFKNAGESIRKLFEENQGEHNEF